MTKTELIERIVDSFDAMSSEWPSSYLDMDPLTIEEATMYLDEQRALERDCDLEPEECLPEEVTPQLYMEAENCYIKYMKHEARVEQLAEYLTDNECVCEYDSCRTEYLDDPLQVYPTDWLFDSKFPFKMIDDSYAHPMFLIELGQRSPSFNPNHEFCWYDRNKNQLFSSDTPFADGIIDAQAFARYIIDDKDTLLYFLDHIMDDEEIKKYFECTISELKTELNAEGE